jgi:peptidyl-prolyl cis-trans isomerase A (cyclophilin A)
MTRVLIILCFFMLLSCSTESKKETVKESSKSEKKELQAQKKKRKSFSGRSFDLPKLTSENCVELLSEYGKENPETRVRMTTPLGELVIRLYNNTPVHRANFIYMTKQEFFDETVFYRVIDTFMIQGGNSDRWETQRIKADIGKYTLPAEIKSENFHKRGAIAAARSYTNNPDKKSSPFVFYIVQRGPIDEAGMKYMEIEEGKTYSPEVRQHYLDYGGTPGLDGEHSVFGEVISGMDVVDAIAKVETDGKDWPKEQVWIKMEVID